MFKLSVTKKKIHWSYVPLCQFVKNKSIFILETIQIYVIVDMYLR